jgi:hypothetical protein
MNFRQYLTKQSAITISDRRDACFTLTHPNPLPPRGEGIDRRDACPTGINVFNESNPYRKFAKGLVLKRYC